QLVQPEGSSALLVKRGQFREEPPTKLLENGGDSSHGRPQITKSAEEPTRGAHFVLLRAPGRNGPACLTPHRSSILHPLPIDPKLPEIVETLRRARSLVLTAPPGSGKTTRVPPAILRAGLLSPENPALVLLQPRRVAARAAASRIAEENEW